MIRTIPNTPTYNKNMRLTDKDQGKKILTDYKDLQACVPFTCDEVRDKDGNAIFGDVRSVLFSKDQLLLFVTGGTIEKMVVVEGATFANVQYIEIIEITYRKVDG